MNHQTLIKGLGRLFLALLAVTVMASPSFGAVYSLRADTATVTMPDGVRIPVWGFALVSYDIGGGIVAGDDVIKVPGPMLSVPPGDTTLSINLTNKLAEAVSIVIPGQPSALAPVAGADGRIVSFTNEVASGGTGSFTWNNMKPGTYIYHSGTNPALQVQMGLYGGVKVDAAAGPPAQAYPGIPYDAEVVLFYSEIDPGLHEPAPLPAQPLNYNPTYFLIDGMPFNPATLPLAVLNTNQNVLIRFLNAGLKSHVPTLQGGYWTVVAEDGNLYPYPKEQYSLLLPPMKTMDVIWTPGTPGTYPVYDRSHHLTSAGVSGGGMLAYLQVGTPAGAPLAADDAYAVAEDGSLIVAAPGVLNNDTPNDGLTAELVGSPAAGVLTIGANGSFTYTPNPNFSGTDTFTYRAFDGTLYSNVANVRITVSPTNDAPVSVDDAAATVESTTVIVNVLANDTDMDGDGLTVSNVSAAGAGSVAINGDNTVTYTPNAGFIGTDTFTYTANDGTEDSTPATVTITVTAAVNQPPVAVDDSATTLKNEPTVVNVLANDYDPDGLLASSAVGIVTITTQPTRGGTVEVVTNGVLFTPKRNFRGTDVFKYTVTDSAGALSNETTVRVNVVNP